MNGLPYYKRYPRDFVDGTAGMPFEEKTAYAFLLDLIYMHAGQLPDDPRFIAGHLGCSVRKWNSIREALIQRGKIACRNGRIENYRAIIELESLRKVQDNSKNAAKTRWEKTAEKSLQDNFNNELGDAPASNTHVQEDMRNECHTESDTDKEEEGACAREAFSKPAEAAAQSLLTEIREAVGSDASGTGAYWADANLSAHVDAWRAMGLTDAQIVAEAKSSRAKNPAPPDGPKALDRWMEQAAKGAQAAAATRNGVKSQASDQPSKPPMTPEDRLKFMADWIKDTAKPCPASAVSTSMSAALLAANLVTKADLRARGIA